MASRRGKAPYENAENAGPRQERPKRRFALLWLLLVLALVVAMGYGALTLAKYVQTAQMDALTESAGFSFSSDYLVAEPDPTDPYQVYDWQSGFQVKLYNTENGVKSAVDVEYEVTVTGGTIESGEGSAVTLDEDTGEYIGGIATGESVDVLTVRPVTNAGAGHQITVSVTTTAPYTKQLSANFELCDAGPDSMYSFVDHGYACTLTIKTGSALGSSPITVIYNENLLPDNTDPLMRDWTNTSTHTGTLTGLTLNATYELIFFDKTDIETPFASVMDQKIEPGDNNTITLPVPAIPEP